MAFEYESGFTAGVSRPKNKVAAKAYDEEQKRLRRLEALKKSELFFLGREGGGVAAQAKLRFGSETDLENLSTAERKLRSTGRTDLGFIL